MNHKWISGLASAAALGLLLSGCSMSSGSGTARKLSDVRPPPGPRSTIEITVPRKDYIASLERGGEKNQARLVPVFGPDTDWENYPEYRLMDVQKGSIYDMLGLRRLDIIVAANDYAVPSVQMFWQFLRLISGFKEASIEIRREQNPMLLKYQFTD